METYHTVMTEDLNAHGTLFGGQLLKWVDESAWMAAQIDFPEMKFVTRAMDSIDFAASAPNGSILRFEITQSRRGTTSVTYRVVVFCNVPYKKQNYELFSNCVTLVAVDGNGKKTELH